MAPLQTFLNWIGGSLTRTAGTGLVIAAVFLFTGMTPWQWFAHVAQEPPGWLSSSWTRLALVIAGLGLIAGSLHLNVWSLRQKAVNELAEDISWAIHHLLNRDRPKVQVAIGPTEWQQFAQQLRQDYDAWCNRVSAKLANQAFFTRADQLHFDRLGFVQPVTMTRHADTDHVFSMLSLKFERLREILNAVQQRTR